MSFLGRDRPRSALRGHARDGRRGVRAGGRGDPLDLQRSRAHSGLIEEVKGAQRALVLGIGGGGDVVGALAVARMCEGLGTETLLGGVAWERRPVDPRPGPRSMAELRGGRPVGDRALLAGPGTSTLDGVVLSEARMAAHLNSEILVVDVTRGANGAAAAIVAAAEELECDLVMCVDVGGDVLARGNEPQLASPLCDAVMTAAALAAADRVTPLLAVIGPGCDGELSPGEVLERVAAIGREGAWLGTWSMTPEIVEELEAAAAVVPTEASLQVVRCARGETGETLIRRGRRSVELGPIGALTFIFDPVSAGSAELPLARAVAGTESIEDGRRALEELGVQTELDYEREHAGRPS